MPATAQPRFEYVLYPNPPMSADGFARLMGAVVAVAGMLGVGFLWIGAWPVTGFLGLDVVALWLAFRCVRQRGRLVEFITIAPGGLTVRRVLPGSEAMEYSLEPAWARVRLDAIRGNSARLALGSHGRWLEVGRFLALDEKRELAAELERALRSFAVPGR